MRGLYLVAFVAVMSLGFETSATFFRPTSFSDIFEFKPKEIVEKEVRRERPISVDRLKEEAIKAKADRLANSEQENQQESASQPQASSARRILIADPSVQQSYGRYGNNQHVGTFPSVLLYIGDTFVIYKDVQYQITNGKVILPTGYGVNTAVYIVCGQRGIALEADYICCSGNLFPKALGPIECCANVFYYTDIEFCCSNLFYPTTLPPSMTLACCSLANPAEPYVVGQESCCASGVELGPICPGSNCPGNGPTSCCGATPLPLQLGQACCGGNTVYNTQNQFCCGNNVQNVPCLTCPLAGPTLCCGNTLLVGGQACCGGNAVYNTQNQFCCGNNVQNFPCLCPLAGSALCCGNTLLVGGQACCGGNAVYNTQNQFCCGNNVQNVPCLTCPLAGPTLCCGNTLLVGGQACCGGNAVYNTQNQFCCGNNVQNFPCLCPLAGSALCCGNTPLPPGQACCGANTVYDPQTLFCCGGVVQAIQCQGNCPLNGPNFCCGSNVLPLPTGMGCCNAGTYLLNTQCCCGGVVLNGLVCPQVTGCPGVVPGNFFTRNLSCCGGRAYVTKSDLCCNNVRYDSRVFCCRGGQPRPLRTIGCA